MFIGDHDEQGAAICPMLAALLGGGGIQCMRERCMWWVRTSNGEYDGCAVHRTSFELHSLAYEGRPRTRY